MKRIAIIGKFYIEGFGLHIEEALHDMGHEVVRIDPEINLLPNVFGKRIANINKTLYQQVFSKTSYVQALQSKHIFRKLENQKIDLTLSLHDFLSIKDVEGIKKITKAPVALWFPDHIQNIQKAMFFIAGYDYLFFKDHYMVDKFRNEYGLPTFYLPQCCNPKKHNKVELSPEEQEYYGCDLTNAGNLYSSRAALYRRLKKYKFKMWGNPPAIWMRFKELEGIFMNRPVYNQEKSKAFSAAKIVLNNLYPAEINGVNKRTFEVSACGGFQITNHTEALEDLYEIDKEVVVYKNFDELIEKIEYYLNPENEEERIAIIEAAYKRSVNEHTYENRMKEIFKITGIQ